MKFKKEYETSYKYYSKLNFVLEPIQHYLKYENCNIIACNRVKKRLYSIQNFNVKSIKNDQSHETKLRCYCS